MPDAQLCQDLGVDAIGLNFYAKSLRCIDSQLASELVAQLDTPLAKVGVFVNNSAERINELAEKCQLDYIQLHGAETTKMIAQIELPVIRAIPWAGIEQTKTDCEAWADAGVVAVLLDSVKGKQFGGTGQAIDWAKAAALDIDIPLILAGGLQPANVQQAIELVQPAAVDTASGTEDLPGKKSRQLLCDFVHNAQAALDKIDSTNNR